MFSGVDHEPSDLGNPRDVFHSIFIGETEITIQTMPDIVAVQEICVLSVRGEPRLHEICDR